MFKNKLKNSILVVCNDAGGANQIYYLLKEKKIKYKSYLSGPAIKIFKKKRDIKKNLKQLIINSDIVILGSGTGNFEHKALKIANFYKKHTIVFLENWVNFKTRFTRKKNYFLPKEIWVSDKEAFNLTQKIFNKTIKIKKVKNSYLAFFKNKIKNKTKTNSNKALYLSPNYDMSGINKVYRKKVDLRNFLILLKKINNIKNIINRNKIYLDIILHPGEKLNKYSLIEKKYSNLIKVLKNRKIENMLINYKYAISTNSYALLIAKKIGLVTINHIKGTGIKKTLPNQYIDYLV